MKAIRGVEKKAVQYVNEGRVEVEGSDFAEDGSFRFASGTVEGSETYHVKIYGEDHDLVLCSCPFGRNHSNPRMHSHDIALRLQALLDEGMEV